jgi:hypothetical protein
MIIKRKSSQPGFVCVCFELPAYLWADRVYLVGDFNNWDRQRTLMHQARDGVWRVELELPCGKRFEFRYLVDNHWLTDCHSDGVTTNPFGSQNSIVETIVPLRSLDGELTKEHPSLRLAPKRVQTIAMD